MQHWLLDSLSSNRRRMLRLSRRLSRYPRPLYPEERESLDSVICGLEMAIQDILIDARHGDTGHLPLVADAAMDGFHLLQLYPLPPGGLALGSHLLRLSSLAILGEGLEECRAWLRTVSPKEEWPFLPVDSENWGARVPATVIGLWLSAVTQSGPRRTLLQMTEQLWAEQSWRESQYLDGYDARYGHAQEMLLAATRQLLSVVELLATWAAQGGDEEERETTIRLAQSYAKLALDDAPSGVLTHIDTPLEILVAATSKLIEELDGEILFSS